jgi:hypothetical protein
MNLQTKKCFSCGLTKPLSEFYTWSGYKDGHQGTCKQCIRYYQEHYRKTHLLERRATEEAYRKRNIGILRRASLERRAKIRLEVLAHYGKGKLACIECGFDNLLALSIDHINNNGNKHRKIIGSGHIVEWLKANNFPEGYQTLCMNCQFIKARKQGKKDEV